MSNYTPGPWKFKYHMNIDGVGIMEAEFDVTVKDLNIIAAAPEMKDALKQLALIALNYYFDLQGKQDEEFVKCKMLMGHDEALCKTVKYWIGKASALLHRIDGDEDEEEDEE